MEGYRPGFQNRILTKNCGWPKKYRFIKLYKEIIFYRLDGD
jgi:hypothetical protein